VRTIAVCFDEQVVDALDVEAHDMTVDIIVTDVRVIEPPSPTRGRLYRSS
jgi:5-formyltetrahydrofolate cyclo-ligase